MVHVWDFMLGVTFPLWTLTWSTVAGTLSEGQSRVVGAFQPVVAVVGDDVILPCHLEPPLNMERTTVEWSKPDLKPDPSDHLSQVEYVHLRRSWDDISDMQMQAYVGRTKLFPDQLKHGNISLKITNVTLADEGRYKCHVPKLQSQVKESIVKLVVETNPVKSWTTGTTLHPENLQTADPRKETNVKGGRSHLVLLIPAVLFVLSIVVFLLHHNWKQHNLLKYDDSLCKPLPA
ncbi:myelin-oligodendrocyte glycoprotein-like [Chaetodon auriga]|uniref:myelin-oligodendrocyte glycoprotein-like n=1 Tax=Chaetodon auriga TaxID=39042 RepID=UPI004032D659